MARRSRRIQKKLHLRYADDVILAALSSDELAPQLRELDRGEIVPVRCPAPSDFPQGVRKAVNRWNLVFNLSVASPGDVVGDPHPVAGATLFKLLAAAYPGVCVFAEELPEHLGSWRAV